MTLANRRGVPNQATLLSALFCLSLVGCVGVLGSEHQNPRPRIEVDAALTDAGEAIWPDGGVPSDAGLSTIRDAGPVSPIDAGPGNPDAGSHDESCYEEPIDPLADVSDIVGSYGGSGWQDQLIEAVGRRHPASAFLLNAQRSDRYFSMFSDSSDWGGMVGWLDTLVHEETHLFNGSSSVGGDHAIFLREDRILYLPASLEGFPRSEIMPLVDVLPDGQYSSLYLRGSQGERGFIALIDEATCYINEMIALGLFGEYYPGAGVSSRDGSVAFLYYVQLYLRRARTAHPAFYATLRDDPAAVAVVAENWLRTHLYLEHSMRHGSLGIDDARYREAMYRPENLNEMAMFVGRRVGDSNCYLD